LFELPYLPFVRSHKIKLHKNKEIISIFKGLEKTYSGLS